MAGNKPPFKLNKEALIIMGLMCVVLLWTVNRILSADDPPADVADDPRVERAANGNQVKEVEQTNVPLATGKEPIDKIFIQSGCTVCHTIPGIRAAKGREGPKLELGTNARKRLADPDYHGKAQTDREYVQESILHPGAYVVTGYSDHVMPRWYGQKLSAGALDKIITYLLKIEEVP